MGCGRVTRAYVRHRWVAIDDDDAQCFVCGILESDWLYWSANAFSIEWDCKAVQESEVTI